MRDYMMVYAWEDLNSPGEVKFGDHFVEQVTLKEAVADTEKYMRNSLARQKYKWGDGRIRIWRIWDVSDYAKKVGRFYKKSHVDDDIRAKCLINRISGSEFHTLSGIEVVNRVEKFLKWVDQPKPPVVLSTAQYRAAEEVIDLYNGGSRIVLAGFCARFGKTIWSAVVGHEIGFELTIIVSYVKTVFTSFENDLLQFEQFKDYVHVDTQDPAYQSKIDTALKNGNKVIAYLSMCNSVNRQTRIDYLFALNNSRYVIIDEADFGVHKKNQADPLINARNVDDFVVLMTGTNSDRAISEWKIDNMVSVTYPELLINKKLSQTSKSGSQVFTLNNGKKIA